MGCEMGEERQSPGEYGWEEGHRRTARRRGKPSPLEGPVAYKGKGRWQWSAPVQRSIRSLSLLELLLWGDKKQTDFQYIILIFKTSLSPGTCMAVAQGGLLPPSPTLVLHWE